MNYIKLEYQNKNFKPYFYSTIGLLLFTLGTVFVMAIFWKNLMPKFLEPLNILKDKESFILFSQILIQSCFSIFSAMLFSKVIKEDSQDSQEVLLFSYPISRIIGGKILFVSIWTVAAAFLSTITCLGTLKFFSDSIPILKESDLSFEWETILTTAVVSGVVALMIGGISLAIGFKNKSYISTIITSLILCSILSNIMQLENGVLTGSIYGLLLVASIGSIISVVTKTKRIKTP